MNRLPFARRAAEFGVMPLNLPYVWIGFQCYTITGVTEMSTVRIFVSHSSKDKNFAEMVVAGLRDPRLDPWIDSEQIFAGDDIFDKLGEGLQSMDILVFLVSRSSLQSEWVALEVKYAVKRELEERRALILPYIIDDTPVNDIPWFLSHRDAIRVSTDATGVEQTVQGVQRALERRVSREQQEDVRAVKFRSDPRVEELIADVGVGDWDAAYDAALRLLSITETSGDNELFQSLLKYVDYPEDDDLRWGALLTIESFAQLAPWLYDRELLFCLGHHPDFSVRSSAASICMDLVNSAPHKVPIDLLLKLARFDEDWYVMAPATAALKALCASRPAIQRVFFNWLHSDDPAEREHAASAIADIAHEEPEILEPGELTQEATRLKEIGDHVASGIIAEVIPLVANVERGFRFKYGL